MQGLILINKHKNITSFGAVATVRRICGTKRVGHTGTLDPLAEGILPVLVGRATALSPYVTDAEKSYTARVRLGITTDTEDITGEVLSRRDVCVDFERLCAVAEEFVGESLQVPPMFSAIKKDGRKLYSLARQGVVIEREPRRINLSHIAVRDFDGTEFTLDVTCSKGTYIRSLCRDIGERLGCGAVMSELVRTETAGFSIDRCVRLDSLTSDNFADYLLPSDYAVANMPYIGVTEKQAVRFSNGGELDISRTGLKNATDGELLRIKYGEVLLGIGRVDLFENAIKVDCVINNKDGSE